MKFQSKEQFECVGDDLPVGTFHLHSGFTRVANFMNDAEEMVYLTTNKDLMAANAIFASSWNLTATDCLVVTEGDIRFGNSSIDRQKAEVYHSEMNYSGFDFNAFEDRLLQLPAQFMDLIPTKSLFFLLNPAFERFFVLGFDNQFMLHAKRCCDNIRSGEVVAGLAKLRGTGYGLTPSGDDFIAGFLLGLHYNECKSSTDLTSLRESIFTVSTGGNMLVNAFLKNAKNRKYFSPLKKVLLLLSDDKPSLSLEALEMLLAIGETSGADFLTGFIFPVKYNTGL